MNPPGSSHGGSIFRLKRFGALMIIGASAIGSASCAETAKQAARSAAPAAAEGTLDSAKKPDNRQDIATIVGDPQIRQAASELARSMADGVFDALADEERVRVLEQFSERLVQRVGPSLAKSMLQDIRPALAGVVAESVDQSIARLLSEANQQRATAMAVAITQSVLRGMSQQVASDIAHLGAADNLDAATDLSAALARSAGRGVALGIQDAVHETELRRSQGHKRPGDILALAGQAANVGVGLFSAIAAAVVGGIVVLCGVSAWFGWRARRFRREAERREDALLLLARVIKSTENAAWANELHERIRNAAREDVAGNTLRDVLRRHGDLRLQQQRNDPAPGWVHDA